jgi:hypothetical protein
MHPLTILSYYIFGFDPTSTHPNENNIREGIKREDTECRINKLGLS